MITKFALIMHFIVKKNSYNYYTIYLKMYFNSGMNLKSANIYLDFSVNLSEFKKTKSEIQILYLNSLPAKLT